MVFLKDCDIYTLTYIYFELRNSSVFLLQLNIAFLDTKAEQHYLYISNNTCQDNELF